MAQRSLLVGVLIGAVLSLLLTPLGTMGSIIVGLAAGLYVGGGFIRGAAAGFGVWIFHMIIKLLFITYFSSSLFGGTGLFLGMGAGAILGVYSLLDALFFIACAAVGGLLSR